MIDIVTINFNNDEGLRRTLDSLSTQTIKPTNVFVIDGFSSDTSLEVANSYRTILKLTIISEVDNGIYDAMNKGIGLLTSRYCLFLNSGDELCNPSALSSTTKIIHDCSQPLSIFCFSSFRNFKNKLYSAPAKPIKYLEYGMITNHQSMIYPSELLKLYPFDLSYKIAADYQNAALLLSLKFNFNVFPSLFLSIFHEDGLSSSYAAIPISFWEQYRIYSSVFRHSPVKSFYYLLKKIIIFSFKQLSPRLFRFIRSRTAY